MEKVKQEPLIPIGATEVVLFDIKKNSYGRHEAFIGFKSPNGNFNFIQIDVNEYVTQIIR